MRGDEEVAADLADGDAVERDFFDGEGEGVREVAAVGVGLGVLADIEDRVKGVAGGQGKAGGARTADEQASLRVQAYWIDGAGAVAVDDHAFLVGDDEDAHFPCFHF